MIETVREPAAETAPAPCENGEVGPPAASAASSQHEVSGQRAAAWIPLVLLAVLPLFPPETRGESFAGCAVLLALWCFAEAPRVGRAATVGILPGAAIALVGLGLAADAPGAAVAPSVVAILALVAAVCATATGVGRKERVATVLIVVASVVSLHAIYQRLWGLPSLVERLDAGLAVAEAEVVRQRAMLGRAFAAFPTPAALGGFLGLTLPVTVAGIHKVRGGLRAAAVVACALQGAALVATVSATAVAALAGAAALWLLTRPGLRRWVLGLLAVAGLLTAWVIAARSDVRDLGAAGHPLRLRAGNFRIAADITADRPWLGVGPGGYGEAFPRYRLPGDNESRHVHDLPLQLFAELGLPLGVGTSIAFFAFFMLPLRRAGRDPLAAGIAVGLAAFAIHNFVDFTAFLPSILWLAVLLRGAVSARPAGKAATRPAWGAAATAGLAALLAVGVGLGENAHDAARQARADGDEARVARLAQRSVRLAPWHVDGWLLRSSAALARDDLPAATSHVERALELSPVRPAAHALRARVRYRSGDVPGAWVDSATAARLYPMKTTYAIEREQLFEQLPRSTATEPAP